MRRIKIRILPIIFIILLLPLSITPQMLIAAEDITYDVSNSWFKPSLILNNNPAVCKPLLDGYMNYFKGTEETNPLGANFSGERVYTDSINLIEKNLHEVPWDKYQIDSVNLKIAQFNLNDHYYALVRHYYSIGWREGFYNDILISQPLGNLKLNQDNLHEYFEANNFGVLAAGKGKNIFDVIYQSDPRYADYKSNILGTLANIYQKNGSVYLLLNTETPQPNTYMLFEFIDQKQLDLNCSLVTTPSEDQIREQVDTMPAFKGLRTDLLDMVGDEGNCGTARFLSTAKNELENTLDTMTYRPWDIGLTQKRISVDENLNLWGYSGIWNYFKYKSYLFHLLKAEEEVKDFYVKNFRIDRKSADEWVDIAISYSLVAGFDHGRIDDNDHNLHKRILDGMSVEELSQEPIKEESKESGNESLLTFAIAHPELVEVLLKKGFNPNAQNAFGKTPLMYAAQFNMLESAKILLKHGAATELTTTATLDTCNYTIKTKNVSALHYAVRYSSKDFIELLLDTGAPTYIQDSNGYTPYDYLVKFGGFDASTQQPSKNSYGELNQNLTADDRRILKTALLPPATEKKKDLFREVNVMAEELYAQGRLEEAYRLLKRAISLNPDNERALSNLSLVALKLGKLGESAKLSTTLIGIAKSDAEKANAYFNLGLACQKVGVTGYHYSTIEYDGRSYCRRDSYTSANKFKDESALPNFLEAYKLKPTKTRLNAILALLQNGDMPNKKRLCIFPEDSSGIKSLYFSGRDLRDLYFLIDSSKEVPFKNVKQRYGTSDRLLNVAEKESVKLSDNFKIEKWTVDGYGFGLFLGSLMMDDTICTPSFPNAFPSSTKLIEVYSLHKERTPRIIKWKQTIPGPVVLILYGNYVEWQLEGDLSKTAGVYVHGHSSRVKLPDTSGVPTFADNEYASEDRKGSSFNMNTRSVTGLLIDTLLDVRERDKEGCRDHSLFVFERMPNYYIVECTQKEFDSEKFPTEMRGGGAVEVEGRKWQIDYKLEQGAQLPTPLEILRHHTDPLKKIGGTVPYESSDHTAATLKLALGRKEIWCNLGIRGDSYRLSIIEREPMIHGFVDHVAEILATGVDSTGRITIHGISSTGHAAIYGIYFDFNKSEVKPESERALRAIGEYLAGKPNLKVFIVGHTDNVEGDDDNMKLSQARADAVMKALTTKYKVNPQNLKAYGVGPLEPVAPNRTEAGRARNRRVEFVVQ